MIAGLLYAIGLIVVLVTIVMVGFSAPPLIQGLTAALEGGTDGVLAQLAIIAGSLGWSVTPLVGGLALMGFGRVIFLLGSINRSLRGPA
jgi:hypothetical protein